MLTLFEILIGGGNGIGNVGNWDDIDAPSLCLDHLQKKLGYSIGHTSKNSLPKGL